MSTMNDRNIEIWSTRLQREILALESSSDEMLNGPWSLPTFVKTTGHTFNTDCGIAKIEFIIEVELGEEEGEKDASAAPEEEDAREEKDSNDDTAKDDEKEGDDSVEKDKNTADEKGEKLDGGDVTEDTDAQESEATESKDATKSADAGKEENDKGVVPHVVLVLDASLYWEPDASSGPPQCYPFLKPLAIIKSGSHLFSGGSTISDGDEIDIDLDWTPSIHLSDAITNVALKVRECIKRGEPLHPANKGDDDEGLSGALHEARESLLETKKAMGAMFSSGLSSLSAKGSSIAAKGSSASKSLLSLGESLAKMGEELAEEAATEGASTADDEKKAANAIPEIGDEIDLSEEPWNQCIGMYSCKAIKRPAFVEAAMSNAPKKGTEASSAGSMFSRFAQSAKSVMEESFLMVTEESIIEFKSNKLNIGSGTVSFAIKIDQMAKLKFRREESLSLFFKQASDDPLVYMCLDSALAVHNIQDVLKRHGVKGKHTNAATQRSVQMALNLVALIQQKEKELIDNPTVDRVNEIMDLYRQAAEKFESAGDPRHAEVMAHMKRFLGQQFTTSILDGSFVKVAKKAESPGDKKDTRVPQGEVLEQPKYDLSEEVDDDDHKIKAETPIKETDHLNDSTLQNMEGLLNEAVKDMSDLGMEDDDINEILSSPPKENNDLAETDETLAELDAMLSDADKELNELLNS